MEHNVAMHKVECSAGDAELHEFMKVKLKEDSEIYEECRAYNYAVRKQREEQEEFFKSQLSLSKQVKVVRQPWSLS